MLTMIKRLKQRFWFTLQRLCFDFAKPFSQKTLLICLKNGVKSFLPPFESLESLTNNSSNDEIVGDYNLISNRDLTLESINPTNGFKEAKESQKDSSQQKSKKPVNTSVEQIEQVTHMASKVCPVCKTYSSSSNTALNAHIDQCLSGESSSMKCPPNPKETVEPSSKTRIKPRKMRLMSDIYRTAPHCTIKQLDARNGRAVGGNYSSVAAQELEFEGDVYIDNNGTKVRILSVPKVSTSNSYGARKLLKREKSSKMFIAKKKNKLLKLSPSDKKLCSRNPYKAKTLWEENDDIEEGGKDDGVEEVMNRDDYRPIVLPQWACSKRTFRAKRANLRTPLPLTKPSYADSCLVKRSNIGSKGSKLPSSKKQLTILSALKPSSARSLPKQSVVVGPLQDSSTRVEEDTSVFKETRLHNMVLNSCLASEEQHDYDMSDSPISTVSNPVLARSDSDKFSVRSSGLLNDQHCCCLRKESVFSQNVASSYYESTLLKKRAIESLTIEPFCSDYPTSQPPTPLSETIDSSLPLKLTAYDECGSVGGPSKPVLRLMGKNLTVVNTDLDLNCAQFPLAQNEHKFPSLFYQPHHPSFQPPNDAFDTMHRSTSYVTGPQVGPMIPQDMAHEDRNRFGVHACFPFGKWYLTPTAGSSRSSAI